MAEVAPVLRDRHRPGPVQRRSGTVGSELCRGVVGLAHDHGQRGGVEPTLDVQIGRPQRVLERLHLASENDSRPLGAPARLANGLGGASHVERDGDGAAVRGRTVGGLAQELGVVGVGPPAAVRATALVPAGHAGARIGHGRFEHLDGGAVPGAGQRGQEPPPPAHPAGLIAGREQHIGRVGDRHGDREALAMRVVHHARPAVGVLVEAQRGGVTGKGHGSRRPRRGDSGPVLDAVGPPCAPSSARPQEPTRTMPDLAS